VFSHQLFPKDATPGFGGAVHQILTDVDAPRPAAAPLPSTPSAVGMLTAMLSRIRAESEEEGKIIGGFLSDLHAEGSLARRIDLFLSDRHSKRQARFQAEAKRLNDECRKQDGVCNADYARLNPLNGEGI
jgi:hypothetical protein